MRLAAFTFSFTVTGLASYSTWPLSVTVATARRVVAPSRPSFSPITFWKKSLMDPLRSRVSLIGLGKRSIRMRGAVLVALAHTQRQEELRLGIERHGQDILIGGDRLRNMHDQGTLRRDLPVGVTFHLQLDHAQAGRAVAEVGELEGRGQLRILAEHRRQRQVARVTRALGRRL